MKKVGYICLLTYYQTRLKLGNIQINFNLHAIKYIQRTKLQEKGIQMLSPFLQSAMQSLEYVVFPFFKNINLLFFSLLGKDCIIRDTAFIFVKLSSQPLLMRTKSILADKGSAVMLFIFRHLIRQNYENMHDNNKFLSVRHIMGIASQWNGKPHIQIG